MSVSWSPGVWTKYVATRDPVLRERIIIQYAPLVKYVVGRLAINLPTVLDSDDILSYGTIGLIDAVERFDPARGIKFETYAIQRIRGAIIDGLRALDQIPRTARQRAKDIERAMAELEAKLGRPPTDEQIAEHLGMDLEQYHQLCLRVSMTMTSLDNLLETDDEGESHARAGLLEDPDSPNPEALAEQREVKAALIGAVRKLPERERLVLSLYYYEELTMKEISRALEISESRVCQLHSQAILRLRTALRGQQSVA